jgi:hypothetical protein
MKGESNCPFLWWRWRVLLCAMGLDLEIELMESVVRTFSAHFHLLSFRKKSIESSFSVICQTLVVQLFCLLCFAFVVSGVYSVPFVLERVN